MPWKTPNAVSTEESGTASGVNNAVARTAGLLARTLRPYLPPFALAALADPRALWHVVGVIAGLALVGAGAFVVAFTLAVPVTLLTISTACSTSRA